MKNFVVITLLSLFAWQSHAQVMGMVSEKTTDGQLSPLVGASVHWLETTKGTTTNSGGHFQLERVNSTTKLIISYVGYQSDTIETKGSIHFKVILNSSELLENVVVEGNKVSTQINTLEGINTITMTEDELFKAACCNLSESFETNPSVDVSFTDAVTGTRQIQMLGLAGPNTMIGVENMPGIRGLGANYGLSFIPGTWINSIQVTKGVGSVVNGHESIAGQINTELKKPQDSEKLFFNAYGNQSGRTELNLNATQLVGKKWGTTVLLHGSMRPFENDTNNDGFVDFPVTQQLNFVNRWLYKGEGNMMGQIGVKVMTDNKVGGQKGFNPDTNKGSSSIYGLEIDTKRYEAFAKVGYLDKKKPFQSAGLQMSAMRHEQQSYFGNNNYDAIQNSAYGNFIFQSIIGTTAHKFKTGVSLMYDQFDEQVIGLDLEREEIVPGVFYEYTYEYLDKFTLVAGVRVDHNSLFGSFVTPRLHLRYAPIESTTFRASAGRGQRTANIFAENTSVLATSRAVSFNGLQTNKGYGFEQDKAWNFGVGAIHDFKLDYRPATLILDFYHTRFENQVVLDLDSSPIQAIFTSLNGDSYSNSLQAELNYELTRRFDVRMAYRWIDVNVDFNQSIGLVQKPMVPENRAFINLAYKTRNDWAFDFTTQWVGRQRLPDTSASPEAFQRDGYSPDYALMSTQITKSFDKGWDIYVGSENLGNYKQDDPIVNADNPFASYFDTTMVWAPIFGRTLYAGVRYRIK